MIADKVTKLFSCQKWITFKRLDPLVKKSFYNPNRSIRNDSKLVNKLLHTKNAIRVNSVNGNSFGENAHAYKIMSNSTAHSNSLSPALPLTKEMKIDSIENLLGKQWISMGNSEILENFKLLSHYVYYNSNDANPLNYKGVFEILAEKCSEFNDKELFQLLELLLFWSNSEIHNSILWRALDKTCLDRLPCLSTEPILLISDYLYRMNLVPHSNFIYHGMRKLDAKKMTPANLVQYAFLMKVKGPILELRVRQFEFCVEKNLDNFNIEELGVICMAFFKFQTAIKSQKLLSRIIDKLQAELDSVSDISLSSILKTLRYSADLNIGIGIDALIKSLETQVEDRDLMTLTHMALAQATLLIENKVLLQRITEKFSKDVESARIKDIERLLLALYLFNCDPKTTPFYSIATEELQKPHRRDEIYKFTKPFVYAIMYMLKVNYLPEELVKAIMSPGFIRKFSQNDISTLDREYLDISYCLQIDHPEYQGPTLGNYQLRYLLKKFGVFQKEQLKKYYKVDHADRLMIDISHQFKRIVGSETAVHVDYPLPHCPKHYMFLCYDPASQSFVSPKETLQQIPLGEIKYAPKDGKRWTVVVPASHNVLTRNSYKPTGALAMQVRQLERIGYNTIVVSYAVWHNLMSPGKKTDYITKIINDLRSEEQVN